MKLQQFIFTLTLLTASITGISQIFEKQHLTLSGTFYDESTGETVPFANIFNESQRRWVIGKEDGEFKVPVEAGDTLAVTMIGYLSKVIIASEDKLSSHQKIILVPRQYDIDEIQVVGYRNYQDFKKAFSELKVEDTEITRIRENLTIAGTKEAIEAKHLKNAEEKLANPGFSAALGSPVPSVKVIIDGLKKQDEIQYKVDLKYNRNIVGNLTGLEDDDLTSFMGYCNFTQDFLLEATEYEIVEMIMKKFRIYRAESDSTGELLTNQDATNLT